MYVSSSFCSVEDTLGLEKLLASLSLLLLLLLPFVLLLFDLLLEFGQLCLLCDLKQQNESSEESCLSHLGLEE